LPHSPLVLFSSFFVDLLVQVRAQDKALQGTHDQLLEYVTRSDLQLWADRHGLSAAAAAGPVPGAAGGGSGGDGTTSTSAGLEARVRALESALAQRAPAAGTSTSTSTSTAASSLAPVSSEDPGLLFLVNQIEARLAASVDTLVQDAVAKAVAGGWGGCAHI